MNLNDNINIDTYRLFWAMSSVVSYISVHCVWVAKLGQYELQRSFSYYPSMVQTLLSIDFSDSQINKLLFMSLSILEEGKRERGAKGHNIPKFKRGQV